jgi:hypothetical protein
VISRPLHAPTIGTVSRGWDRKSFKNPYVISRRHLISARSRAPRLLLSWGLGQVPPVVRSPLFSPFPFSSIAFAYLETPKASKPSLCGLSLHFSSTLCEQEISPIDRFQIPTNADLDLNTSSFSVSTALLMLRVRNYIRLAAGIRPHYNDLASEWHGYPCGP